MMRQEQNNDGRVDKQHYLSIRIFLLFSSSQTVKTTVILQIYPLEGTTIFTVILFSFADVNTRKNFACINFGVRVDSCRQVKLL